MLTRHYLLLGILTICMFSQAFSQASIADSILNMSYKDLKKSAGIHIKDSAKASVYAHAYIKKAKADRDTLKIVIGQYLRLFTFKNSSRFDLYDTIIDLSKNLKNKNFPTIAYYDKGAIYHNSFLYKNALDNYLKALHYNEGDNKEHMAFLINKSIGFLKSRIDKNDEALSLMKRCWKYALNKDFKNKNPTGYYSALFSLANTYRKASYLDSARVYTRLGLLDKYESEYSINYNHFLLLDAIIKTHEGKYYEAEKGYLKALPQLNSVNDPPNIALGLYFQGKNFMHLNKQFEAIKSYKQVDSIFEKTGDIIPELISGYQTIIKHYNNEGNLDKQLHYTQKLIAIDSVLSIQYKNLNTALVNNYDIPLLVKSKEHLINRLELKNKRSKTSFIVLIGSLFLIIGIAVNQSLKRQSYKKRFEALLSSTDDKPIKQQLEASIKNPDLLSGIPQEIIDDTLKKLSHFEADLKFTKTDITLSSLAKQLHTNTNYLSRIINHYKENRFASYLKQLRVTYAFERLKEEPTLRKYTIKAIAKECGFKSAESFSKTFYKVYRIYPSYFIKQLENNNIQMIRT